MQVAISSITIPPNQIRLNPGNLQELADNIKQYGLLHPVVVNEQFELIAGYRRLKAVELLGWTDVPVTIISPPNSIKLLTEFDLYLSENIQRKDLSAIELSEAIFERKVRFEQVYGPIKNGGDRRSDQAKEISLQSLQTDPPNFYEQTARLLKLSTSAIYQLLRLQGIDDDLKVKVHSRELSYATALSQQAERNQTVKNQKKPGLKTSFGTFTLPNRETADRLTTLYKKAPKLFQLFQLVYHSWQTIHRLEDYQSECDHLDLEFLHNFIVQLGELLTFYTSLFTNLQKTQELQLNAGIEEIITSEMHDISNPNPSGD